MSATLVSAIPASFTHAQMAEELKRASRVPWLVHGLLADGSVGLLAGDPTIGKSPLLYQLAICVATGTAFLNMKTRQGPVLMLDFENHAWDAHDLRKTLARFLGLPEVPEALYISREASSTEALEKLVEHRRPVLVIIDPLRRFAPDLEEKNSRVTRFINDLQRMARQYSTSFLIVHHLRKEDRKHPAPSLDVASVEEWMQEVAGMRGLFDHTAPRIAVEARDENPVALRVKWNVKLIGDSGLLSVLREYDADGQPIGYSIAPLRVLLGDADHAIFGALPPEFRFSDAHQHIGGGKSRTNRLLKACLQVGALERQPTGVYRKLAPAERTEARVPPETAIQ